MTKTTIEYVLTSKIVADPDQPRKNFDAADLATLIASIKAHGIQQPLHVEKMGDKYLLEDGERRFRAAKEIGLKEVPVLVQPTKSATERLIIQFHLQEQHKGWNATEKATAVAHLAEQMKLSVKQIGQLLSLHERTIGEYMAFAQLLERKTFEKSETPLYYATKIVRLREYARRKFESIEMEFTKDQQANLERSVIHRIKSGDIRGVQDLTKVHDSIRTKPESILKWMKNDTLTTNKLFIEANAKVAYHYRNLVQQSANVNTQVKSGLPLGLKELFVGDTEAIATLKRARNALIEIVGEK